MSRREWVAVLCMLAGASAPAGAEAPSAVWRGNFIAAPRGLMMSPCRSGERLIVEDATPGRALAATYAELAQRPGSAIFIELQGRRSGRVVRAERLQRAYAEGPGCLEDLDTVVLRANGVDPFWNLEMRADTVLVRRPGSEPERFPGGSLERHGGELRYEGAAAHSVLRVAVREAPCRDAMTGGYYTLSASLEWDGRKLAGCAYWGDLGRPR